jgi:hypothetical protein
MQLYRKTSLVEGLIVCQEIKKKNEQLAIVVPGNHVSYYSSGCFPNSPRSVYSTFIRPVCFKHFFKYWEIRRLPK